jgi:hypothetical protein
MTQDQKNKEIQILFALFGATVEQMEMLRGEHKHQVKQLFNKWVKSGQQYFDVIEKYTELNKLSDNYESARDIIHNGINDLRNQLE